MPQLPHIPPDIVCDERQIEERLATLLYLPLNLFLKAVWHIQNQAARVSCGIQEPMLSSDIGTRAYTTQSSLPDRATYDMAYGPGQPNRLPGETKCGWKVPSWIFLFPVGRRFQHGQDRHIRESSCLQALGQIKHYMENNAQPHTTKYGYLITEEGLLWVKENENEQGTLDISKFFFHNPQTAKAALPRFDVDSAPAFRMLFLLHLLAGKEWC